MAKRQTVWEIDGQSLKDAETGVVLLHIACSSNMFRKDGDYMATIFEGNLNLTTEGQWDQIHPVLVRLLPEYDLDDLAFVPHVQPRAATYEEYLANR